MSVKFWDMKFDGTMYRDEHGNVWRLACGGREFILGDEGCDSVPTLTTYYTHKELVRLTFEVYAHVSNSEKVLLEELNGLYTHIARDKYGDLYLSNTKPTKKQDSWLCNGKRPGAALWQDYSMYNHLFKYVTWEDAEATEIASLLK